MTAIAISKNRERLQFAHWEPAGIFGKGSKRKKHYCHGPPAIHRDKLHPSVLYYRKEKLFPIVG